MSEPTIAELGFGYAPSSRDALKTHLASKGFELPILFRSGRVAAR